MKRRRSIRPLEDLPSLFSRDDFEAMSAPEFSSNPSHRKAEPLSEMALDDSFSRPRQFLRLLSFGSGSSGNCTYVGTPDCGFIIDAGVDNNFVMAELARNGIDISTIKGIFLTHDHGDHVRFAYALVRRQPGWRIFATNRTIEGVLRRHNLSRRIKDYHSPIFKEHEYRFGNVCIIPFETSHDGTDNVGFSISIPGSSLVIATDTGYITERADYYLRQASAIMIESNYDDQMLSAGRYPEFLKNRIRSEIGHMDNSHTAQYIKKIYTPTLSHILLCHLSQDNNTPETAMATMLNALRTIGINPAHSSAEIPDGTVYVAALPRYKSSELYILTK